jgi:site-specific recombinase
MVTRTLAENPELARQVTVLFPDDVCDINNWNRFGDLGIHLMDGAWRQNKGPVRARLERVILEWQRDRLMKESLALGKTRHHPS